MLPNTKVEAIFGEPRPADALHRLANTVSSVGPQRAGWRLRWGRKQGRKPRPSPVKETHVQSIYSSATSLRLHRDPFSSTRTLDSWRSSVSTLKNAPISRAHLEDLEEPLPGVTGATSSANFAASPTTTAARLKRTQEQQEQRQEQRTQELKGLQEQLRKFEAERAMVNSVEFLGRQYRLTKLEIEKRT